jgi:hypothetical protein
MPTAREVAKIYFERCGHVWYAGGMFKMHRYLDEAVKGLSNFPSGTDHFVGETEHLHLSAYDENDGRVLNIIL